MSHPEKSTPNGGNKPKPKVINVGHALMSDILEELRKESRSKIVFQSRYQIGHFYVVVLTPVAIKREVEFMGKPRVEYYLLGQLIADTESLAEASKVYTSTSPDLDLENIQAIGLPKSLLKQILQEVSEEFIKGKRVVVAIFNVQAGARSFKGKPVRSFQLLELKEGLEGNLLELLRDPETGEVSNLLALSQVQEVLEEFKKALGVSEDDSEEGGEA